MAVEPAAQKAAASEWKRLWVYTPSDLMRADVYTKHMPNKDKFEHGLRMIGVFPAGHLSSHVGNLHVPHKGQIRLGVRSALCILVAILSRLSRRA